MAPGPNVSSIGDTPTWSPRMVPAQCRCMPNTSKGFSRKLTHKKTAVPAICALLIHIKKYSLNYSTGNHKTLSERPVALKTSISVVRVFEGSPCKTVKQKKKKKLRLKNSAIAVAAHPMG